MSTILGIVTDLKSHSRSLEFQGSLKSYRLVKLEKLLCLVGGLIIDPLPRAALLRKNSHRGLEVIPSLEPRLHSTGLTHLCHSCTRVLQPGRTDERRTGNQRLR
jgi:hypothetical protein